ncbi:MAG TPA: four helix bundle protein [Tepidiformaceae bacterium]|nr:four helix bundle protein [Tepidiformaceae bacterium]
MAGIAKGTVVPAIQRFEDLFAWQKARELTREVYLATQTPRFSRDFGLSGQIQRASVSIMANLAEGFERGSRAEFHQFLSVAKASCAEVRSHLYVESDVGYLSEEQAGELLELAEEVTRIVAGLRRAVEKQRDEQRSTK